MKLQSFSLSLIISLYFGSFSHAESIRKVEDLYSQAVLNWDAATFQSSISAVEKTKDSTGEAELLKALCYWRLAVIASMDKRKTDIRANAENVILEISAHEKKKGENPLSVGIRGLAHQMLAGQGVTWALKHGPKSATALEWLEKNAPAGYWTRLLKALNQLNAPGFAGGDAAKALFALQSMAKDYPDSLAVTIHLSLAYKKNGNTTAALSILDSALQHRPHDRWLNRTRSDIISPR